jgi:hypothetical protein
MDLSNFINEFELFTIEECNEIIKYISNLQDTVYTVRIDNIFTEIGCSLKSQDLEFNQDTKWIFDRVQTHISKFFDWNWTNPPHAIFRNYKDGDFFVKHKDNVDSRVADKRYLTVSIQLTDDGQYIGGDVIVNETQKLSRKIGTTFLWGTNVPHEVTPITKGERNSLILFVSEKHIEIKKSLL